MNLRDVFRGGALGVGVACWVATLQPQVQARLANGYAGDDFWTLAEIQSPAIALGLAMLAATLCCTVFVASAAVSLWLRRCACGPRARIALDVILKLAATLTLLLLAPQLFYAWHRLWFEGLPAQRVIRGPDAELLRSFLIFAPNGRLADHVAASLVWGAVGQGALLQSTGWTAKLTLIVSVAAVPAILKLALAELA